MNTPKVTKIDVCIYHAACSDGFGAAWAVYKRFGDTKVEYLPGSHASKEAEQLYWVDKVKGKHVVCYDFSFSRELTEKLHSAAKSFQVIDHHLSASKELGDLSYCYFDMEKSGAMLAWESVFYQGVNDYWVFVDTNPPPAPKLLKYVQDRDLWAWKLPESKAIWSYISSLSRTFAEWDQLSSALNDEFRFQKAIEVGKAMSVKVSNLSEEIAKDYEQWTIAGYDIIAVNCPSVLRSDVCESLGSISNHPFVGCYHIEDGTATWSLRSNHGTEDVSAIASAFPGGGGHKEAAGFTVPIDRMDFKHRRVI